MKGSGSTDDRAQSAGDRAQERETGPLAKPRRVEAQEEPTAAPGRDQDEHTDRQAQRVGRCALGKGKGHESSGEGEQGEWDEEIAPQGFRVDHGSAAVRRELHDAVDRNGGDRVQIKKHDGQQHAAARHAQHGGDACGQQGGSAQDRDGGGFEGGRFDHGIRGKEA